MRMCRSWQQFSDTYKNYNLPQMKLIDFELKGENHFIAMQYYGLIFNRTFLVVITNDFICSGGDFTGYTLKFKSTLRKTPTQKSAPISMYPLSVLANDTDRHFTPIYYLDI